MAAFSHLAGPFARRCRRRIPGVRRAIILENNIVQTTGSAGESIAFLNLSNTTV
jgi:hypothetical protein